MIAIIDYGVGNLFSLEASLAKIGAKSVVTNDVDTISSATHIVLPGVGAFGDAMKLLKQSGMDEVLLDNVGKKPILGICLGMQLLFDKSYEFGETAGLGIISGEIKKIDCDLKIPHMGWNKLEHTNSTPILSDIGDSKYVYFVHSFYAQTEPKYITSVAEYGLQITASVQKDSVFGCQFHPEKSGDVGLEILKNFYEYKGE
ncbi:MAG: imidazole glycerol phosphate synthase, glutamine amidotransferase subunit [Epulopiscium sp. Nele67-Bin004]|nr:MAG: imidazole glycerol phosphate synthase, glutamine amidotransferase subunit [Epulopiscium sp. Nele67-Bin004]